MRQHLVRREPGEPFGRRAHVLEDRRRPQADAVDDVRAALGEESEPFLRGAQGHCRSRFGVPSAPGEDPIGEIPGGLGQQVKLLRPKRVGLGRVHHKGTKRPTRLDERQGGDRRIAAPTGILAPWPDARIGEVAHEVGPSGPDRHADGDPAAWLVGPAELGRIDVPEVDPGRRDGPHGARCVILRVPDPSQPVAAGGDQDLADLVDKLTFVGRAHDRAIDGAQHA